MHAFPANLCKLDRTYQAKRGLGQPLLGEGAAGRLCPTCVTLHGDEEHVVVPEFEGRVAVEDMKLKFELPYLHRRQSRRGA